MTVFYFAVAAFVGALLGRFLQIEATLVLLALFALGTAFYRRAVPTDEGKRILLVGVFTVAFISTVASFLHFAPGSGLHAVLEAIHDFLVTKVFR